MTEHLDADTLRALEARLDRAAAAAERLLSEAGSAAVRSAVAGSAVPPRGWQRAAAPGEPEDSGWLAAGDAELLFSLLAAVRERIPADLQQRLLAAVHEVLQALRALIDWCLERAERRRETATEVQDIPIL